MAENTSWQEYCFKPENALGGNAVRLLKNGDEAFAEMLKVLREAREYILLEFYAFSDDSVGCLFRDLLLKKVKEGVRVCLIYDAVGSVMTDRDFFSAMSAGGVKVGEFRPVVLWKPYWNWIKRDHRKIICVDGEVALVGGFNISAYDAPVSLGGHGWKDAQVRVEGAVVGEVERLFWESWAASSVAPDAGPLLKPGKRYSAGNIYASVVSASGMRNFRSIRRRYSYAIDRAKRYIYITNAYFLPDRFVYRRLIKAVRRGVDVRIIGPYKTDHPYIRWATWSIYPHMIKNGIKMYEWKGGILHSKTAVIDGIWSSVGSHNLDHRSLHYNLEVNINVYDRAFGSSMAHFFRDDLKNSKPVTLDDTRVRPFLSKAASKLLYLFRSWL
ncbi:MAG: phospholipase D-like domain-containing protein [Elusimicrobiota bacterium]